MNIVIRQDLFRHRNAESVALNNLCTVVHKLSAEGRYVGEIGAGKRVMGRFLLRCHPDEKATQVNIDLSMFDEVYRVNAPNRSHSRDVAVGKGGYVVFHATGHHRDLWATLEKVDGDKRMPEVDTRSLSAGDLIVFRLWYPGAYALADTVGGTEAALNVVAPAAENARQLSGLEPVRVKLTSSGFAPAEIQAAPAQAVILHLETEAAVTLKSAPAL